MRRRHFIVSVAIVLALSGSAWAAKSIPFLGLIPEPQNFSKLQLPQREFTNTAIHSARYVPEDFCAATLNDYPDYENSQLPLVKNQYPYGTCWTFAAVGAAEIYAQKHGLATTPDFSELHLAWFAYKDPGKSFSRLSTNGILDQGGNSAMSTAMFARLAGPVNESALPYSSATNSSYVNGVKTNASDYPSAGLRLIDASRIDFASATTDSQRDHIKNMILECGAVMTTYYAGSGAISAPDGVASYYVPGNIMVNHGVLIVGWDDNYSRKNFDTQPQQDGA